MTDLGGLPASVRARLADYFNQHGVEAFCQADVVLALLRMGELGLAQDVLGRPITRCPPAIPPWPPKPVRRDPAGPAVAAVARNPCLPTTDAFRRFSLIRPGMTREKLVKRGVTARDLLRWTRQGHLEWTA